MLCALSDISVLVVSASQKRFTAAEVLKRLNFSEDEYFDDNDSDQDSDNQRGDLDLLVMRNVNSKATEAYDRPLRMLLRPRILVWP